MAAIFISHSSHDDRAARALRARLAERGFRAIFLDYHPEDGIPAGRNWEQELYRQVNQCSAVIFLGSRHSRISRWCFAELALANSLGKPVFPVKIQEGARHPLLEDIQWIDLSKARESGYMRLWRGLRAHAIDPVDAFVWDPRRSPYPGLASFEEQHAAVFFGRSEETQALFERVNNSLLPGGERFVAVIGPSGSGKSSLVRAGLIPRLKRAGAPWVVPRPFVPQDDPVEMMARSLASELSRGRRRADWRVLRDHLAKRPRALVELSRDLLDSAGEERRAILIFVDQAEELVTVSRKQALASFVRLVRKGLEGSDALRVVITVRSEFLTPILQRAEIADLIRDPFLLGPMPRARLESAIAGPAQVAGLSFAPGLVGRIVQEAGGGDALPLMAFTMSRLYERVSGRGDRTVTEQDYREVGGVDGAVRKQADAVRERMEREGLEGLVLPVLLKLVAVEQTATATRRRVTLASFSEQERAVIRAFVDARLVASEGFEGEAIVYVSHEALFRAWPPLEKAVEIHENDLRLRSRLEQEAKDWAAAGRPEGYLLQGERLTSALRWREAAAEPPKSAVEQFLMASAELRGRGLAREADLLGNRIIRDHRDDPQRAILVALEAIRNYGHRSRLHLALSYAVGAARARARIEKETWTGRYIWSLALSPDAARMAVGLDDGAVMVIKTEKGEIVWEQKALEDWSRDRAVLRLAFAGLGGFLAIGDRKGKQISVLEADSGKPAGKLDTGAEILSLTSAGEWLAAGCADGRVLVWSTAGGFPVVRRIELEASPACLAVSSDGKRLLAGCSDKSVYIADFSRDELVITRQVQLSETAQDVAFSPDGTMAACAGSDGRIWTPGDQPAAIRFATKGGMLAVRWPEDTRIVTADERVGLRTWDAKTGLEIETPPPPDSQSRTLTCAADGALATLRSEIVSAGNTRSWRHRVWVWDSGPLKRRLRKRIGDAFSSARFADKDRLLVTRSNFPFKEIAIRNASDGEVIRRVESERSHPGGMVVAPDGQSVAAIEPHQVIRRFIPDLELIRSVPVEFCNHVAFTPDCELITASSEGVVQRWRTKKPETLLRIGQFYAGSFEITRQGKALVAGGGPGPGKSRVSMFDLKTGRELFRRKMEDSGDLHAAVSPDGSRIAIAQQDSLFTVTPDGELLTEFTWGRFNPDSAWAANVGLIAFAGDSKRLATASAEGWICVWDAQSGELIQLIKAANEPLKDMAFSASGQELVVCTAEFIGEYDSNGYAEIWPCPDFEHLEALALQRTFRELTPEERAQYGLPGVETAGPTASVFHLAR